MPQPTAQTTSEDLCRLLAACWHEPGADFDDERLFDSLLAAAQQCDPAFAANARRVGESYAASGWQQLQHQYQHLFAGPAPAIDPHESRWRAGDEADGEESALALHGLYQAGGFEAEADEVLRPDHIAVELEFLWIVTAKEHQAQRAGFAEVLSSWQLLRGVFLRQHIGAWIGPFAAAVHAHGAVPFYLELAQLTALFVAAQAET